MTDNTPCGLAGGATYIVEAIDPDGRVFDSFEVTNVVPQSGVDYIAGLIRGQGSIIPNWYVGLGEGNYVPSRTSSAADLPATAVECLAYSQTTRPVWSTSYDGVSLISNADSRAEFTLTADKRLYTAFLISSSAKGGNTGTIISFARFPSPKDYSAGTTVRVVNNFALFPTT